MRGTYYITERQQRQIRNRHVSTRRMIVEIPESLFHEVNRARGRFSADGVKNSVSFHTTLTGLLHAVPMDGEV